MGMGIKSIASAFDVSRNTVRKYVRRYQESGLRLEQLMTMHEDKLQEMFLDDCNRSRKPSPRRVELDTLIPDYVKRLSRKGLTVKSLHEEYLREHPDGYKYSNFKRAVRQYRYQTRAVGHVEHAAGDQMYVDYAGDKLEIVDAETGEVRSVEVFVAILPCSHYTYCEAVWSQKKEDLIVACENALHFFGGAPMAIVPDNLKAAVTRSDRNEPVINEDFAAMAEFYDMAVFPARARRPKDKALVENAVKLMYRSVYADIVRIGLPTSVQNMIYTGISFVLTRLAAGWGDLALAVLRMGNQIESVSWNISDGFAASINAFTAQNYGARQRDRIRDGYYLAFRLLGSWGLFVTAMFLLFAEPISGIFFHEAQAVQVSAGYLRIVGLCEAFMCIESMTVGALSGLGKTRLCSAVSITLTGARIPYAWLLCRTSLGLTGIWWALSISSISKGIVFFLVMRMMLAKDDASFFPPEREKKRAKTEMKEKLSKGNK